METLQETYDSAEELLKVGATSISCSLLMPLPETQIYKKILNHNKVGPKYKTKALIDFEEISKDWVDNFCFVAMDEILDVQKRIMNLTEKSTGYGVRKM